MLIFYSSLKTIPADLYEAAAIDGAGTWRTIAVVKLPALRGALVIATIFSIIGSFQLFNEPTVMRSLVSWMGNDYTPMMMAYNTAMGQISPSGSGPASAISILMALVAGVLAVIYALVQRKAD